MVHEVESVADPRVEVYRSLRRVLRLREDNTFIAEGARVTAKLLASDLVVRSMLCDGKWLETFRPVLEGRPETVVDVFLAPKRELEQIVGFHVHQGVMTLAEAPQPPPMIPYLRGIPNHVVVALSGVSSPENVGGILRSVAAFGAHGLVIDGATCDPFVRRTTRVSMGASFRVPTWRTQDLPGTLRELREKLGTRIVAAHLYDPVVDLDRADLSGDLAIVLGSEATGLSDEEVEACDVCVRIPMNPAWDCFNVGIAGAIVLWETARRRRAASTKS